MSSPPPVFRDTDRDNLEFVRQIVLTRLREDQSWSQFDYVWDQRDRPYVRFEGGGWVQNRFLELANEVMWQLIMQGVITPGMNASNPNLPWFRITDYGKQVLAEQRFVPHDPAGYLKELKAAATTTVTSVSVSYVEEALNCFTRGCHVASVLLLGVAAESVFLELCNVVKETLTNPAHRRAFEKLPDAVKPKHRWIVEHYQALPASTRKDLPESLDMTLTSLYDLIRRQRNELGHPQPEPPTVDRERAFVAFRLFPTYASDVEALVAHCRTRGF